MSSLTLAVLMLGVSPEPMDPFDPMEVAAPVEIPAPVVEEVAAAQVEHVVAKQVAAEQASAVVEANVGAMPAYLEMKDDFDLVSAATKLVAVLFTLLVGPLVLATGVLTAMLIVRAEEE